MSKADHPYNNVLGKLDFTEKEGLFKIVQSRFDDAISILIAGHLWIDITEEQYAHLQDAINLRTERGY